MTDCSNYLEVIDVLKDCRNSDVHRPLKIIEIVVDGSAIENLCKNTIDNLYNIGIMKDRKNQITDTANLLQVVHALVVEKISIANPMCVDSHEFKWRKFIECWFTRLPKILNTYIQQIGTFTYDNTKFTPKTAKKLCYRILVGERILIPGQPDNDDSFTDLRKWYADFIYCCSFIPGNYLQPVDLAQGNGTAAQLVGCRDDSIRREMWCNMNIRQNVLELGGLFGFGLDSRDKFHDKDIAVISASMAFAELYRMVEQRYLKY